MIVCVLGKPAQVILLYLSACNIDKCNAFSEFNTFFTFNAFLTGLRASPQSFEMMLRNTVKSTFGGIFRIISQANLKGIIQDINRIQEIFFQKMFSFTVLRGPIRQRYYPVCMPVPVRLSTDATRAHGCRCRHLCPYCYILQRMRFFRAGADPNCASPRV